jgi:DNA-binding response OmpR family regulator
MKILVVDDELIIRKLLYDILTNEGHEVFVAKSGGEAIDQARKNAFDLILSDVHMPDITGLEVVTTVREFDQRVVFVMMDSFPDVLSQLAQERGAITCIHKPFALEELRSIVREVEEKIYGPRVAVG